MIGGCYPERSAYVTLTFDGELRHSLLMDAMLSTFQACNLVSFLKFEKSSVPS